jgi:hypothetical protein
MGAALDALARTLVMVQNAGCRRVGLLPAVEKVFRSRSVEERYRKRLERYFGNYGIPGTTMPQEHFKSEGRFPTGGKPSRDVHVFVFKAYQCRIYGVALPIKGVETFVGMEIVTDKKQDDADQGLLRRVARNSRPYWE